MIHNRIAVDWDDVCRRDRKPLPGTQEALEAIVQEGIEVVIFSCVATTESGREMIISWLEKYDIPYSDVTAIKPLADAYVDDKAIHHISWEKTIPEINKRLGVEIEVD